MERHEIVNLFLEKGMTIDPKGLEHFYEKPEQVNAFFEKIQSAETKPTIVNIEIIRQLLEEKPIEIKEIKKHARAEKTASVESISKILVERYERIQGLFADRINLVDTISVNRIGTQAKKFSLIVMVREKDEKNREMTVEDLTGEASVHAAGPSFDLVVCDEVIGLVCEKNGDRIEAVNIVWPDIPLKREIPRTDDDVYCIFVSGLGMTQEFEAKSENILERVQQFGQKQAYIFLLEDDVDKNAVETFIKKMPSNAKLVLIQNKEGGDVEGVTRFSSPAFLEIGGTMRLLLCSGKSFSFYKDLWKDKKPEEVMLNLLKKRHLDPLFGAEKIFQEEILTIDVVPDIFVAGNFGSSGIMNHKGTTLISCGDFSSERVYWIVNLRTRESIKMDSA